MKRYAMAAFVVTALLVSTAAQAQVIVWDGGDGNWNDPGGNWNGSQDTINVFGRSDGFELGSGEVGTDVFIADGHVTYDPDTFGDFRFRNQGGGTGGSLTIAEGASLSMDTILGDVDGQWTQFNADTLNLDNGTFRRGFESPAEAGGIFSFGGIRSVSDMDININLTNGGRIENDGALTFGWYLADVENRTVTMTINDGHLDLTGSDYDYLDGAAGGAGNGNLQFHLTWNEATDAPNNDQYAINFTGPGSITVDHAGILVVVQTGPTQADFDFSTITDLRSYEDLWDFGILQADGMSGTDGAIFDDFFRVEGESGSDDYRLISMVGETQFAGDVNMDGRVDSGDLNIMGINWQMSGKTQAEGDLTGDGIVNAADLNILALNWLSGVPAASTVPEPGTAAILLVGLMSACAIRRRPTCSTKMRFWQ